MKQLYKYSRLLTLALVLVGLGTASTVAQSDMQMQISGHETYVGMPVTLYIQVAGDSDIEAPEFPIVDGLDILSEGDLNLSIIKDDDDDDDWSIPASSLCGPGAEDSFFQL